MAHLFRHILVAAITLSASGAAAQDAAYWTNQYGTRATLLGGLVVGSYTDLSSTYYNPGAGAFVSESSLMLATNAFQLIDIDLRGSGLDFRNLRVRPSPGMFATDLRRSGSRRHRLSASVLTRRDFDFEARSRRSNAVGVVAADARFRTSENWLGLTWSHPLRDDIGLGATLYGAFRSQETRFSLNVHAADPMDALSQVTDTEFRYWHGRLLAKIGVAMARRHLTLGVTVTTPSLGVIGSGEVFANDAAVATDASFRIEGFTQKDLSSDYRSPFAVAVGGARRWGDFTAYATAEWFDDVPAYDVLDPDQFIGQTTGDTISVDIQRTEKDVINWGLGLEAALTDDTSVYGAFFTDDPSTERVAGSVPTALGLWNITNVSVGVATDFRGISLTSGVSFGFGNDRIEAPIPSDDGPPPSGELTYRSLSFLIGIEVNL